jgi:hypothetical protein
MLKDHIAERDVFIQRIGDQFRQNSERPPPRHALLETIRIDFQLARHIVLPF